MNIRKYAVDLKTGTPEDIEKLLRLMQAKGEDVTDPLMFVDDFYFMRYTAKGNRWITYHYSVKINGDIITVNELYDIINKPKINLHLKQL